ncbi:putative virion structural protein [Ralstonia phage RP31]|uniref:Putative virion structural protein n=2 Tax=Ripduovirus RP12 TaxID=2560700 RepID=A0A1L7N0S0_9CAUD|nr:virion structural protein [Ralstonia phage RP12]BAW19063.1 putative virion structural protein [Ralstonia phage RP12]BAW19348.1 putative virion structural protein [Ralstonia phage RP31]
MPVLQLVRDKPLSALLSKAVDPTIPVQHTANGTRKVEAPSLGALHNIASRTANNISHADTVMQMLPDMQLGAQILVSSVMAPKDMMTLELSYSTTPGILPPTVLATVTQAVRDHFDSVYKIKNKIPRVLHEILFEKGSHVVAVIPENSIDEMINRSNAISMEAFQEALGVPRGTPLSAKDALGAGLGFLGAGSGGYKEGTKTKTRPGLESMTFGVGIESLESTYQSYSVNQHEFSQAVHYESSDGKFSALEGLYVTDNPNVLRIPKIEEKLRRDTINAKMRFNNTSLALEALGASQIKLDDRSLKNLIYKPRKRGVEPLQAFKTENQLNRRSVGHPLVMELPPESVIPVCTPGQEDRHVGYFVLLDQTGNPVKAMNEKDSFGEMSAKLMKASNQTTNIVNRLRQLTEGLQCSEQEYTDVMVRVYADMVEQDLLARLRNGVYANSVSLAKNTDYYRVMLSRVLAQQSTTILFMPADMVTYFARKYNQYGIGVSILDEMKILSNMRAIAMMGNTILGIKNSIPRTQVSLQIDETDPDPYKTSEVVLNEIARINQTAVPFGASAPVDIADYFQRAQYQVRVTGHPAIPETNIEYEEKSSNYQKVDTDLEKSLQERALMAMGLNADHINNGFNQETATSVVANNLMLSRRVMTIQDQVNPHITDYHRKIIRADEILQEELREILFNAYDELEVDEEEIAKALGEEHKANIKQLVIHHIINDFVEGLEVTLPRPNTATVDNQMTALNNYTDLLDKAIEAYLSEDFFTDELGGELSRNVDSIKKMIRAHFIRQFMAENAILPELAAMVTLNEQDEPEINLWETQAELMKKLMLTLSGFMKKIQKTKQDTNEVMDRLNQTSGDPDGGSGGGSDWGGGGSSETEPDGGAAGSDPLGGDGMDFPGLDDPTLTDGADAGAGAGAGGEPEAPKGPEAPESEEPTL